MRTKLRKLNEASRAMATTSAEKKILQDANEKLAISKFQQNIRDNTIRVLVISSTKTTLDEAIQTAMQKELMERSKNIKSCTHCGLNNHSVENCRKKKAMSEQNKSKFQRPNTLSFNANRNREQPSNSTTPQNNNNQFKPKTSNESSNNHFKKPEQNYNKGNNNNKNIRAMDQESDEEELTLLDLLEEQEEESKN